MILTLSLVFTLISFFDYLLYLIYILKCILYTNFSKRRFCLFFIFLIFSILFLSIGDVVYWGSEARLTMWEMEVLLCVHFQICTHPSHSNSSNQVIIMLILVGQIVRGNNSLHGRQYFSSYSEPSVSITFIQINIILILQSVYFSVYAILLRCY